MDEEALNNDTAPMDTNIPKISTGSPNNHSSFFGLDLGLRTPYKPSKVENLNNFRYDKATSCIIQQEMSTMMHFLECWLLLSLTTLWLTRVQI
jgi:hypothetical protein